MDALDLAEGIEDIAVFARVAPSTRSRSSVRWKLKATSWP